MLTITKNTEQIAQVDRANWFELESLWPLSSELLAEIPTTDLECFADPFCVEATFSRAECYVVRAPVDGRAQPIGFIAVSGVREEECEPSLDTYLLDKRAQTAAFYAQLGLCNALFQHPDVHAIEVILASTSLQTKHIEALGFTNTLIMNTNVPRGPLGVDSYDSQWILQDPSVLRGSTQHDLSYREGWERYQRNLTAVEFAQKAGSEPLFAVQ